MKELCLTDLQSFENDHEPRIQDLRLAGLLGFGQARDIRKIIDRNRVELERYGVCATVAQTHGDLGGRPGTEYWLNEGQVLLICVKSETARAADVREQVIKTFMEWRRDRLATPPVPTDRLAVAQLLLDELRDHRTRLDEHGAILTDHSTQLAGLSADVAYLKDYRPSGRQKDRRRIAPPVKAKHVEATYLLGGRCPCCGVVEVVGADGVKLEGAEFDHFNSRTDARLEATWLICFDCNRRDLDKAYSKDRRDAFGLYQQRLKNLLGSLKSGSVADVVVLPVRPTSVEVPQAQADLERSIKLYANGSNDRYATIYWSDVARALGVPFESLPENLDGYKIRNARTGECSRLLSGTVRYKVGKSERACRYYLKGNDLPWSFAKTRPEAEDGVCYLVPPTQAIPS